MIYDMKKQREKVYNFVNQWHKTTSNVIRNVQVHQLEETNCLSTIVKNKVKPLIKINATLSVLRLGGQALSFLLSGGKAAFLCDRALP